MVADSEDVHEESLWQRYRFAAIAVAVVLAVAGLWAVQTGRAGDAAGGSTAVTLKEGAAGPTPKIGEPAPDFTLATVDGKTLSLSDLRGRPVLLNFWATWCAPCRGEMPDLENLASENREAGLTVLGVNLQEDRAAVQRYAATLGITFPLVLDRDGVVASQYNLVGLPTSYLIDREGIVRDINIGALTIRALRNKTARIL